MNFIETISPILGLIMVFGTIALGFHLAERGRKQDYEHGATPQPGAHKGPA